MDTKSTVYISGGEVKVVTLLEKLSSDFWMSETGSIKMEQLEQTYRTPEGFQSTLNRLVTEVRRDMNHRSREQLQEAPAESSATRFLSAGQQRQGVVFTHAAVGMLHGLRRAGLALSQFFRLMIMTPVI